MESGKQKVSSSMTQDHCCRSILIIEDHDEIREAVEDALVTAGYRAYSVRNGREASRILKSIVEADQGPCLILLDMMMPKMNGWEFMEVNQEDIQLMNFPVVVMSALEAPEALVNQSVPVNAQGYIRKPIDLKTLLEMVRTYCSIPEVRPDSVQTSQVG